MANKLKYLGFSNVEENIPIFLNKCAENLLYNILLNAKYVLEITNRKIIKIGHLKTITYIQKKSIGVAPKKMKSGGGHTVMPPAYFATADSSYVLAADLMQTNQFDGLDPGMSRSGIPSTFGPGLESTNMVGGKFVKRCYIEQPTFDKIVEKLKTVLSVKIAPDALEMIRMSVELNIDMLIKETRKRFKLTNAIKKDNIVSVLKEKKYIHFTSKPGKNKNVN